MCVFSNVLLNFQAYAIVLQTLKVKIYKKIKRLMSQDGNCNKSKHHKKDDETCDFYLMFAIFMYLIIWWFFTPTMFGWRIETLVTQHTQKFSDMVGFYILYTYPILILALLGTLYLHLTKKSPPSLKAKKSSSDKFFARASRMWRMLWTRPVFINCVFGVMAVVDLVAVISTLVLVFWLFLRLVRAPSESH